MSKYVTEVEYSWVHRWFLITNLYGGDTDHTRVCFITGFPCKPTAKQIRKHYREAKAARPSGTWRDDYVARLR